MATKYYTFEGNVRVVAISAPPATIEVRREAGQRGVEVMITATRRWEPVLTQIQVTSRDGDHRLVVPAPEPVVETTADGGISNVFAGGTRVGAVREYDEVTTVNIGIGGDISLTDESRRPVTPRRAATGLGAAAAGKLEIVVRAPDKLDLRIEN